MGTWGEGEGGLFIGTSVRMTTDMNRVSTGLKWDVDRASHHQFYYCVGPKPGEYPSSPECPQISFLPPLRNGSGGIEGNGYGRAVVVSIR